MRLARQHGAVLVFVTIAAIIAAISSYYILIVARSRAAMAGFWDERMEARYIAEAAIVQASSKLWSEHVQAYPPACAPGATGTIVENVSIKKGSITVMRPVSVTVTNCGAGNTHSLTATVSY